MPYDYKVTSDTHIVATAVAFPANTTTETACVTVGQAFSTPMVVRATATTAASATPALGTAGSPCYDSGLYLNGITAQILGNQIQCDPSMNCTQPVISTTDGSEPPVQNVVVGQPIILTTPAQPSGITATKTTWTVGGTRIANYAPTTASASVTELTDDDLKNSNITFYWVYPDDSISVTYNYCVDIPGADPVHQCSPTAMAAFNVTGPGDELMDVDAYDQLNIDMIIDKPPCLPTSADMSPYLYYANASGSDYPSPVNVTGDPQGIKFTPPASTSGTYFFVQLVNGDRTTYTNGKSSASCVSPPGLDGGNYPYPMQQGYDYADDSPDAALGSIYKKVSRTFKATMYLLWTSSIPDSIPVPIDSQDWHIVRGITMNTSYPTSESWTQPVWDALGTDGDPVNYVDTAPSKSPYGYPTWKGPATPVCTSGK